jgi:hypothetical protein
MGFLIFAKLFSNKVTSNAEGSDCRQSLKRRCLWQHSSGLSSVRRRCFQKNHSLHGPLINCLSPNPARGIEGKQGLKCTVCPASGFAGMKATHGTDSNGY